MSLSPRNLAPSVNDRGVVVAVSAQGQLLWQVPVNAGMFPPAGAADLTGDGVPEIVVETDNGLAADRFRVIAFRGDGSRLWSTGLGRTLTSAPAFGDLDGDGRNEVVVLLRPSGGLGATLVVLNGLTGAVRMTKDLGGTVFATGGPLLVDLDGDDDGRVELLINTGVWGSQGRLLALEPELPDLVVEGLTLPAPPHVVGEPALLRATVRNVGTRTATDAFVRFTENGGSVPGGDQTLTLAPGEAREVTTSWTPGPTGTRTLAAVADPAKALPEDVERNNQAQAPALVTARPVCDFGLAPTAPLETDTLQLTDLTTDADDGQAAAFVWTFGDGSPASTARNPQHRFADGATYTVSLTATDPHGASCSLARDVAVAHAAPVAAFTLRVASPRTLQFTDASAHANPADAPPAGWAYAWDFGDGSPGSAERSPLHEFPAEALFQVTLTVTDNDGLQDTLVLAVNTANKVPIADFAFAPARPIAGFPVSFEDRSADEDGQVVAFAWDFADGASSAEQHPTHDFAAGGDYPVRLTVTDDQGAQAIRTQVIHVCETHLALFPDLLAVDAEACTVVSL
jgi:PKD repeat protein